MPIYHPSQTKSDKASLTSAEKRAWLISTLGFSSLIPGIVLTLYGNETHPALNPWGSYDIAGACLGIIGILLILASLGLLHQEQERSKSQQPTSIPLKTFPLS